MKEFNKIFESLAYRHGYMKVFDDFLMASICALSIGRMEDQYKETMKGYNPDEVKQFGYLFAALLIQYEDAISQDGSWTDMLGQIFEEHNGKFGRDASGQFFTPPHLCDLMAQLSGAETTEENKINDPACGSGRCLISIDRLNPTNRFHNFYLGMDVDSRCVKMCTLNFFMFGMKGVVIHMNTLSLEVWSGYRVYLPDSCLGIKPLSKAQCMEYLFEEKKPEVIKVQNPVLVNTEPSMKYEKPKQLSLF